MNEHWTDIRNILHTYIKTAYPVYLDIQSKPDRKQVWLDLETEEQYTNKPDSPTAILISKQADDSLLHKVLHTPINQPLGYAAQLSGWKDNPLFKASPLSATLASSVLGAGLGYGAGWLGEQFMPAKSKLKRNLAITGGVLGALPGLWAASVNWRNGTGITDPIGSVKQSSDISSVLDNFLQLDDHSANIVTKQSAAIQRDTSYSRFIDKDEFGRQIWADPYTPTPLKGMTDGLIDAASYTVGDSLISPRDIARIGIGMGSGYVSGLLVGKALGALAGLPESTQKQLQQGGMWAGLIKAVVPTIFRNS